MDKERGWWSWRGEEGASGGDLRMVAGGGRMRPAGAGAAARARSALLEEEEKKEGKEKRGHSAEDRVPVEDKVALTVVSKVRRSC